jgi:hypothetical protein
MASVIWPIRMGHAIYSGIGGQMDFMHVAARSEGGKPIIALPSTACGGRVIADRAGAQAGCGRRDHARSRAPGRYRIRRGQS